MSSWRGFNTLDVQGIEAVGGLQGNIRADIPRAMLLSANVLPGRLLKDATVGGPAVGESVPGHYSCSTVIQCRETTGAMNLASPAPPACPV